jgi:ABC-2 type transport system permease protein
MNAILKLTLVELKLYLRDPFALFFTLLFPAGLLLMFGAIFGNDTSEAFGGVRFIDYALPSFIGLVIANVALLAIPLSLASYRETGVMRRYGATPIRKWWLLVSQLLVGLLFSSISMVLLIIIGMVVFQLRLPASIIGVLAVFLFSSFSLYAISFILAGVFKTVRSATPAGLLLFFPMMFLAGIIFPRPLMPEWLQQLGEFNPLTHIITALTAQWQTGAWEVIPLLILAGILIVASVIALRVFRWQ